MKNGLVIDIAIIVVILIIGYILFGFFQGSLSNPAPVIPDLYSLSKDIRSPDVILTPTTSIPPENRKKSVDELIQDGKNYVENSDYNGAITSFNLALSADSSKSKEIYSYMSKLKISADRMSNTDSDCSQAVDIYEGVVKYNGWDESIKQDIMQRELGCLKKLGRDDEADSLNLEIQREFYPDQYKKFG